ncbi:MAG TPA: acetoacetate--CoA ligase [Kouleothrix sp.]|nr:acetoacetate--CoA ligase [Kouleothrix sp.]
MAPIHEGDMLWQPTAEDLAQANLTRYMRWLEATRGLRFGGYPELWRWSVDQLEAFWASLWEYAGVVASRRAEVVLPERVMPGAQWFAGARLNYAENIFSKRADERPMIVFQAEDQPLAALSWAATYEQTARLAAALRRMGVRPGDRVVAYLPNIPEAIVALLATASLGAIWSCCAPDFGSRSVLDRFSQIEPRVLIAVDGYRYGGKLFDRRAVLAELQAQLPSLRQTIVLPRAGAGLGELRDAVLWDDALAASPPAGLQFEQVPFDHPLWIVYSSGTTGLPKPIVQSHGGILLEHAKATIFHNDLRPGDRFFWFSSTGWMMWNYLVGSLLSGCSIVLYDGSPAWPDIGALWALAERAGITYFGTSAAFIAACMKAGLRPSEHYDLRAIRALGSTGSPLTVAGFAWVYAHVSPRLALESLSGGTDVCTAFVGGVRVQPIYAGEIQGASLGANVQAFGPGGRALVGEVGELVITAPMPSMPIAFWNDPGGARYRASYFDMYPGVWRHGDWIAINERGGCVIYGRSDSTINRQGVRMGTSEIYRVVEGLPEIADSLVVDLELLGRESFMPLFVVLRAGASLDEGLRQRIRQALRQEVSPRHVPDEIVAIDEVPYTLSGKKLEVPIRRILLGHPVGVALSAGSLRNPAALDFFLRFADRLRGSLDQP